MLEPCTLYCPVLGLPFSRPTVKLPTPTVKIMSPRETLYAATQTPLTLVCNIEFDPSLTESVGVSVAWLRGTDMLSNATERVSISSVTESSSRFTSTLSVYPLITNDSMDFTCRARISPTDRLSSTTTSDVGEATVSLLVQVPTITPISITASTDSATAGDHLNMTCSARITPNNLITGPVVSWSGPGVNENSVQLFNGTADNELILSFSPLHTSHGGIYICNVTLSIPIAGVEVSGEEMININIQIPSPSLNIVGFPRDTEFFQGLDLTLTCNIEVHPTVDSSVIVQSSWQRNRTLLNDSSDDRITVGNASMTMPSNYQATLRFNPMDFDDAETYTCTVTVIPQDDTFIAGVTVSTMKTIANVSSFPSQNVSVAEEGLSIAGHPNYTLLCSTSRVQHLTSLTTISVKWLDPNGVEISGEEFTNSGIDGSENDILVISRLIFNSVTTSQAGEYTCTTAMTIPRTEVFNYTVDQPFTVTVKLPSPAAVSILQSHESPLHEGTVFTLLCMITINTTGVDTDFEVERNFSVPDTSAVDRTTLSDTVVSRINIQISLKFAPLILNDTGTYECSAMVSSMYPNVTNSDSVVNESTLSVLQLQQPNVTIYSAVSLPTAGENHTLICQVHTVEYLISPPVIHWSSSTDISEVNMSTADSTLALNFSPIHTSHGGVYTCEAEISIPQAGILELTNSATENVTVKVSAPLLTITDHPVPYNGTLFTLSGVAHLDSAVDTNITAVGVWSGINIHQVTTSPPYQTDLKFQPLSPQNSNDYTLNVTVRPTANSPFIAQNDATISYSLTVQPLPPRAPTIVVMSRHPSSEESCGEARIVNCTANTVENLFISPTITWVGPEGNEVSTEEDANPMFSPETGQLIFSDINANNSGPYMCRAVVNISEAQILNHIDEATVNVKTEPPKEITSLMCNKSLSPSELTIFWEPPGHDVEVLSYLVEVKELQSKAGGSTSDVELVDVTKFSTKLQVAFLNQGLAGMVPYEIQVKAISVAGCGREQYRYCFTQEGVPPPPKNVMVSKVNSTAIIVTWEKQSLVELKGLADYIVEYIQISVPNARKRQSSKTIHVPWTENQVTITNLISGAEYNVSVSTLTSAGISDPVLGVRETSPSSDDGAHYLVAIISGVVLAVIILVTLLVAAIVMIAFVVNKPRAVYKPTPNRSKSSHKGHSATVLSSDDEAYSNPTYKDIKYTQYAEEL